MENSSIIYTLENSTHGTEGYDYLFNKKKGKPFSHKLYFPSGSKRWIITSAGGGVGT
jgi:hypothetical protein